MVTINLEETILIWQYMYNIHELKVAINCSAMQSAPVSTVIIMDQIHILRKFLANVVFIYIYVYVYIFILFLFGLVEF